MASRICFEMDCDFGKIQLRQHGKDHFSVVYGKQVDTQLDYGEAAAKLGQAIMHQQACRGKLDNRMRGEG